MHKIKGLPLNIGKIKQTNEKTSMSFHSKFLICFLLAGLVTPSLAWDATGHRLSAAFALNFMSDESRVTLADILRQHPRYQQDFLDAMPTVIQSGSEISQLEWLLGQAAFWPDIARGLADGEREKYNHPNWHYIDGAWIRGALTAQGNVYLDIDARATIAGMPGSSIRNENQVNNVILALDFNTAILSNGSSSAAEKAIALCWVLHLGADIHQPLHAGALYSADLFPDGDRGGNGIRTDDGTLHSRWDAALAGQSISENVRAVLNERILWDTENINWEQWLAESREILLDQVYTADMVSQIQTAGRQNQSRPQFNLSPAYIEQMQSIARQRLGLSGIRLANWFDRNLN
jgi:hypothetical protein